MKTNRRNNTAGFTIVELLVVLIIIGILCAIGYSNFVGSENKAKLAGLKNNMHSAQVSAEQFGTENGGVFPADTNGLLPFYPGGGNSTGGAAGKRPTNPFTGVQDEALYAESITDSATIHSVRNNPPGAAPGARGQTGYAQCDAKGTSYAITGSDENAKRLIGGNGGTLVLSNQ